MAQCLARQSVQDWLVRAKVDAQLAAAVRGLRGFFLADPDDLSLLPLVEQFASDAIPGESKMYRLRHGNDGLPIALAKDLRGRVLLNTVVRAIEQTRSSVRVAVDDGRRHQLAADFVVLALPASTLKDIAFDPPLHPDQQQAFARLRYGAATRVALQFETRFWKRFGRPTAYGTDQPCGAVWDGNEQQARRPGILTLLAGGRASKEIRAIVAAGGWPALTRRLAWLGRPSPLVAAVQYTWETDRWAKGGYAVFSPDFDVTLRPWLARPSGRAFFAGEHTSRRWQGFMNGAVESGRRAAIEVAMIAGLDYARDLDEK